MPEEDGPIRLLTYQGAATLQADIRMWHALEGTDTGSRITPSCLLVANDPISTLHASYTIQWRLSNPTDRSPSREKEK